MPRPQPGPTDIRLTFLSARTYSFTMAEATRSSAIDIELKRLDKRIEELVEVIQRLKEENRALRQRQESLTSEKTTLLHRNEQVRTHVEAMIGRLKAMEHGA
ncbi:MAG: TIGR02449 family protein [Steroidobacteraceae bacterium]